MEFGIYDKLINRQLEKELLENDDIIKIEPLDKSESPRILSNYIAEVIEQNLNEIFDSGNDITAQIDFANKILQAISDDIGVVISNKSEKLLAIINQGNTINSILKNTDKMNIIRPETSIISSSLFTGAIQEPTMISELKKEILSSDSIDMIVSFIKWSGLRQIIEELSEFTENGGKLRVITTSYMGATDIKAIDELSKLCDVEIYISYNTKTTRLHAKSYIFYRNTGYSTAYIGSSNLSNVAISSGLEWNLKIAYTDQKDTFKKIEATFESYLNSTDFELYTSSSREKLINAINSEKNHAEYGDLKFNFDITPYNYQQEILDKLEVERTVKNRFRNLVVAATGTGKTVISAFDYKNFKEKNPSAKLLFLAHRKEILEQSISCFKGVLKDENFGELFVADYVPKDIKNLFVSVQTFNSKKIWENIDCDYYDFIVVDEIHHAAANTYQKIFTHFKPKILLGLTATPERSDEKSILEYFDNRIAVQIRLSEAIERKLLCPFQYFGVSDTIDLSGLKWSAGGYKKSDLTNVYTFNTEIAVKRAKHIIEQLYRYVTDINSVSGLCFCVSIEHAEFMASFFNDNNIPSEVLTGKSDKEFRKLVKGRLVNKEIKFIFVVDIYNEGVDIPEINTVLFLRPTESLTIFLQQLGRGLRLHKDKDCLTVLDFVGQANKNYNFTEKISALTNNQNIEKEIENGFISVPKGCYIHLEKKAKEYILSNIKTDFNTKSGIVTRIANFKENTGLDLNLSNFLSYYNILPQNLYKRGSFSFLCNLAGINNGYIENKIIEKSLERISFIDSVKMIEFILKFLNDTKTELNEEEALLLNMFGYTIYNENEKKLGATYVDLIEGLKSNRLLYNEISDILKYNLDNIDIIQKNINMPYVCPLQIYATYSRQQILTGLGYSEAKSSVSGVHYVKDKKTDLLFVTLNKSEKDYSPTTMYNDYSINENMFHWQSQSTTSENSSTGSRYINHSFNGSYVMLFVRENKKNKNGQTMPYTFLGTMNYLSHKGSKPMSINWEMNEKIPSKYLKQTNKLIVV